MKSAKEYIQGKLDDLSLEYHNKFYCDLTGELQEVIYNMANREWVDYYSSYIDYTYERLKDEIST